jgi:hypothetical protein
MPTVAAIAWATARREPSGAAGSPVQCEDFMRATRGPTKLLKGLSFDIAHLERIRSRAEAHGLRMVVRLDHGSDVEEYEEMLVFYSGANPPCRWLMWRNADAVFLRSTDGRTRRYGSAGHAINALVRRRHVIVTDTNATHLAIRIKQSEASSSERALKIGMLWLSRRTGTRLPRKNGDLCSHYDPIQHRRPDLAPNRPADMVYDWTTDPATVASPPRPSNRRLLARPWMVRARGAM